MARKSPKGYYVDGEFVAEGSEAEQALAAERQDPDGPSRTQRKNASDRLQKVGEQLLTLRADLFAGLSLPENLQDAIRQAKRINAFGAGRRQRQLIGKLMRQLDAAALEAVDEALRVQHGQSARDTSILHRTEQWRDSLIADDERLALWLTEYPSTDAQQLRALIRQARKDAREPLPGEAQRHGKAYRQIFTLVRAQLTSSAGTASAATAQPEQP